MGTVKYSGPVASFHCPTNAEIRSLKVHFSPKQLGEGTPSPENVREIVGWDRVEAYQTGKNLVPSLDDDGFWSIKGYFEADGGIRQNASYRTFDYISVNPNTKYILSNDVSCWMGIGFYDVSKGPLNFIQGNKTSIELMAPNNAVYIRCYVQYIAGRAPQLEIATTATSYEPYHGSTTNYEFGVLGKNKLNVDAEYQAPDNTNMMPTNKRIFTPGTYCIGMSWSNYYVPNNVTSYSIENSTITITNGNVYGLGYPVRVVPGQAYYLSATVTNGRAHIAYFSPDGTYISGVSSDTLNKSFTVPSDVDIAVIIFFSASGEATFSNVQLELGSTATTYEPYNPNHTVYGGWVDLISGEVVKTWTVRPISQMTVVKTSGSGVWQHRFDLRAPWITGVGYEGAGGAYKAVCSIFSFGTAETNFTYRTYAGLIDVYDDTTETAEDFKTKYGDYTVAYNIIRSELYEYYQLASIQLQTFLSTNNIWSNADYVEVEYDLHETQTILARKQFIVANQPHTVKASGSLVNFNTDMAAKLKECKVYFAPVQEGEGDPSPDNVRAINGWNEIKVYETGKNLIDETFVSNFDNYTVTGAYGYIYTDYIQLVPSTKYRFVWFDFDDSQMLDSHLYVDGAAEYIIWNGIHRQYSNGFTTNATGKIRFGINRGSYSTHQEALTAAFQSGKLLLQLGTEDVPYTSYTGTTIPITFPSEAGTIYGGYVDLVTGEVWETHHKITLDGVTTNCKVNRDYSDSTYIVADVVYLVPNGKADKQFQTTLLCDNMPILAPSQALPSGYPYIRTISAGQQYLRIYVGATTDHPDLDTSAKRIAFVNEYLAEHPTTVVYPLTVPILVTTLTLSQLKSLRGTNNIWSNANGDITVQFWKH